MNSFGCNRLDCPLLCDANGEIVSRNSENSSIWKDIDLGKKIASRNWSRNNFDGTESDRDRKNLSGI